MTDPTKSAVNKGRSEHMEIEFDQGAVDRLFQERVRLISKSCTYLVAKHIEDELRRIGVTEQNARIINMAGGLDALCEFWAKESGLLRYDN